MQFLTSLGSAPATNNLSTTGFAMLENGLRIIYVIIKIAITVFVPKGKHLFDLDMIV